MIAINKIQKTGSSFSLIEICQAFGTDFLDESACRRWILNALHGESPISCPECGSILDEAYHSRFWEARRIRCYNCGKFFTALTGTILSGCHLDFRTVMLLAIFLCFGLKADFIANKLLLSSETIRLWRKKFEAIDRINTIHHDQLKTGGHIDGN